MTIKQMILVLAPIACLASACNKASIIEGLTYGVTTSPSVTAISPLSGPNNIADTITGNNFGTDTSVVRVFFNGSAAVVTSLTNTEIIVQVPDSVSTGIVTVSVKGLQTQGPSYTAQVGQIFVGGVVHTGYCNWAPSQAVTGNIDVTITSLDGDSFTIYNIPPQSSASTSFYDGGSSENTGAVYGFYNGGDATLSGGTVTKLSANTFNFSAVVESIIAPPRARTPIDITGSGTY